MPGPPASLGLSTAARLSLAIMSLIIAPAGLGEPTGSSGGAQDSESALRAALDSQGRRVVTAIEQGEADDLLKLISSRGLTVGIDAEPTALEVIRKQFRERRLSYCLFFDTECYRKESTAARKRAGAQSAAGDDLSLMDHLKSHPGKQQFISNFRREGNSWLGGISVVLEPGLKAQFAPSNVVDLGFNYESGKWKLSDLNFDAI